MVLAGSIALTALPLTASATIESIFVGSGDYTAHKNQILAGSCTVEPFKSNCTEDNLWAYYAESTASGNCYIGATTGNSLGSTLSELDGKTKFGGDPDNHKVYLRYSHDVIFFDSVPGLYDTYDSENKVSITDFSEDAQTDVATIAKDLGFVTPLQSVSGWTAYYGYTNEYRQILYLSATGTSYTISETPKITQEIIKGLYSGNVSMERFLNDGAVFIVPEISYETFHIPVLNALGEQEMNGSVPKTISITKNDDGYLDRIADSFYLCYENKISEEATGRKRDLWTEIESFAREIENFDGSKLRLLRHINVKVNGNYFTSKDLYLYNATENTEIQALKDLLNAKPKSIWKIVPNSDAAKSTYAYQSNWIDGISACLEEVPTEGTILLTEQTNIYVTGINPATDTDTEISLNSCFTSPLLKDNGTQATFSDYAATLAANQEPEAGKKYDADGWQFWEAVVSCGGIDNFSQIELDEKPDSIGVTELNKVKKEKVLVYFPQVEIAPVLEVTAPVVGETPSFECTIKDTVGGYSVREVVWSCGNTLLGENDKFAAGKQYTVKVTLKPENGLSFAESTVVTLNDIEIENPAKYDDGSWSVSYPFETIDPWEDIENKLDDILNGENPTITIPADNPTIPKSVLEKILNGDKPVTIKFEPDNGFCWEILPGGTAPENGIDLTVTKKSENQWATVVNNVTGHKYKMQINISYSGDFGFTANLVVNLSEGMIDAPAGDYFANLYLIDGNELRWTAYSPLVNENGEWIARLKFTHASDWLITIDDKNMDPALDNSNNGGSGGSGSSGYSRPTNSNNSSEPSNPIVNDIEMTWSEAAVYLAKLSNGSDVIIKLNGNTTVPVDSIKAIADRKLKVTFVVDSVRSWKTNGADITAPAAADLSFIEIKNLKTDSLRGISGYQFSMNDTNIPTDIEISFKTEHAGKFANLYKNVSGKLTFVTCAKIGADGKVILPDIAEKGDYVVMLCEFSDRLGDMNNDGVMTAADGSDILKQVVGSDEGKNSKMADMNGDGKVTSADASGILKRIVGLA